MAQLPFLDQTSRAVIRANINAMFAEIYSAIAGFGTKGAANGVASLDGSGHVPTAQISLASTNLSDSANLERVVGTFATSAALQTAFPAASNTGNKGLVGSAAPYTNYSSNGTAWVKGVSASTDLSDTTSLLRIVGTFATSAALQTAFPAASNAGNRGLVGSAAPYASYTSDGSAWVKAVLASTDLSDGAALNAAVTNSVKYAASWNAATNVVTGVTGLTSLANSNPGIQTAFVNTATGTTTVAYLGSITSVNLNDEVLWNPITNAWQLMPYNAPSVLGIFANTGAITYPAASWNGYSVSIGASAPYQTYTSNGSAWVMDDAATINTSIAANTAALSVQTDNSQTNTTYTFVLGDAGQNVDLSNAGAITATIPPHSSVAYPVGTLLYWRQWGAGAVTIAAGAGVTLDKPTARSYTTSAQKEGGYAYQWAQDFWSVYNS